MLKVGAPPDENAATVILRLGLVEVVNASIRQDERVAYAELRPRARGFGDCADMRDATHLQQTERKQDKNNRGFVFHGF